MAVTRRRASRPRFQPRQPVLWFRAVKSLGCTDPLQFPLHPTESGLPRACKLLKSGERGRNRTFNLLIKSQLLCQLSYAPDYGLG